MTSDWVDANTRFLTILETASSRSRCQLGVSPPLGCRLLHVIDIPEGTRMSVFTGQMLPGISNTKKLTHIDKCTDLWYRFQI